MLRMSEMDMEKICDNKIVSSNRFESLCSCSNDRDDFSSDRHAFDKKYGFVATNITGKSVRLGNSS